MIARARDAEVTRIEPLRAFLPRDWFRNSLVFIVFISPFAYLVYQRPSRNEIIRAAPIEHQGYLGEPSWMHVQVFEAATGQWKTMTKAELIDGEEAIAMDRILLKQTGFLSEMHGEVDVDKLEDAVSAFDPNNYRRPTGDDMVYVFGQDLPRTGFQWLPTVVAGEKFRFQGRVYRTEPGRHSYTLRIVDTGETLDKPGGDPDAKPLTPMVVTAQTAHRFPNARQYQPKTKEGTDHGDRDNEE